MEAAMIFRRRKMLFAAALLPLPFLPGCASLGSNTQAQFDQAKAYIDAGIAATLAAAQQYLAGPPSPKAASAAVVQAAMADLTKIQGILDATTTLPSDWKSAAQLALATITQLEPIIMPFLGPAAAALPLVVAVVTAFVNGWNPPPNAGPTPPAALMHKAAQYHHRH